MKKLLDYSMMLAMIVAAMFTFTACGGDDEEPDYYAGGSANIGIHRIDIQFSENAAGCISSVILYGLKKDGSYAPLYEGGKSLALDPTTHTWMTDEIRNISVQTDDGCGALSASIVIMGPNGKNVSSDVTITAVGYVNNKRIKTQVFTLPAGKHIMSGGFVTEDNKTYPETFS